MTLRPLSIVAIGFALTATWQVDSAEKPIYGPINVLRGFDRGTSAVGTGVAPRSLIRPNVAESRNTAEEDASPDRTSLAMPIPRRGEALDENSQAITQHSVRSEKQTPNGRATFIKRLGRRARPSQESAPEPSPGTPEPSDDLNFEIPPAPAKLDEHRETADRTSRVPSRLTIRERREYFQSLRPGAETRGQVDARDGGVANRRWQALQSDGQDRTPLSDNRSGDSKPGTLTGDVRFGRRTAPAPIPAADPDPQADATRIRESVNDGQLEAHRSATAPWTTGRSWSTRPLRKP